MHKLARRHVLRPRDHLFDEALSLGGIGTAVRMLSFGRLVRLLTRGELGDRVVRNDEDFDALAARRPRENRVSPEPPQRMQRAVELVDPLVVRLGVEDSTFPGGFLDIEGFDGFGHRSSLSGSIGHLGRDIRSLRRVP
ncbi:MAG: hypothetical protein EXQ86_09555 [Rhodospirillales bacterium]|nr:hypothetical protein [Rhodospirillales bacterium]